MSVFTVVRTIEAPLDLVFKTVSDINNFSEAIEHIVKIEFLTETRSGVGARFRETRLMRGREVHTELEVTEFVENERIRLVSDAGGTVWDSTFTARQEGECVTLNLTMTAKPYKLLAKLTAPIMRGMLTKALESDMNAVKAHCEELNKNRNA